MLLAADYPFLDVIWTMFIFFLWILWFWLLFTVFADIFRRHDISGLGKTGWILFCILLPFLGVFIYLISQGQHMAERNMSQVQAQQAKMDDYVRETAGSGGASVRDRAGEEPTRQRRDHAGGVQRDQAEGAGHIAVGS